MSDSSQVALYYKEETGSYGVDPGGNGKEFRFTSESLGQDTESANSDEIRPDRQVAGVFRTDIKGSGSVGIELSCAAHDDMLQAALMSAAWTAGSTVGPLTTISFNNGTSQIAGSTNPFGAFAAGDYVYVKGATNTANRGWFKVTAASAAAITVTGHALVTESAGASVTVIQAGRIANGTTLRSFMLEKKFSDLSSVFELNSGLCVDTFALDAAAKAKITGSFGFIGQKSVSAAATAMGTPTAAATNDVLNAIDNVSQIFEGGVLTANVFSSVGFTIALQNNLRARAQIGTLGAISVGSGQVGVNGTLKAYFTNSTILDKYLNFTSSALALALRDSVADKGYLIELPAVRYSLGRRVAGGNNQDVIADLNYTAFRDPTLNSTIRIYRA